MKEVTNEEVEQAIETLGKAQETLDEQGHFEDGTTLDHAAQILSVGFKE